VGWRNGYEPKHVQTEAGLLELAVPQLRGTEEPFQPRVAERLQTRTADLESLVRGMYVRGLSTQDVSALFVDTFGGSRLSQSTVSRVTQQLNQDFDTWRRRDLSDLPIVYLFLDGQYHAARQGTDEKEGVLSAYALLEDGRPVLLHLDLGPRESYDAWLSFLQDLVARGLRDPLLVVMDGAPGLVKAVKRVWPRADRQRCLAHIAGRDPRLPRGEVSPPGQVPMRPVVWGQTWRGNWPRRSRPDNVASVPSPEALTKSRAATKVNAFGAVNASWTSIAGRVQDQGGRVACVPTKTATTVETWGSEAVVSAFEAAAREEGDVRERTRAHRVGSGSGVVSVDIKRDPLKFRATPGGQSEEAIVATKAWTAKPAGAKGLYLRQAS
jgi:hypothetical protein